MQEDSIRISWWRKRWGNMLVIFLIVLALHVIAVLSFVGINRWKADRKNAEAQEDSSQNKQDSIKENIIPKLEGKGNSLSKSNKKYLVKKGDTLSKISHVFDTTPEKIAELNDIKDPLKLREGMEIEIPID